MWSRCCYYYRRRCCRVRIAKQQQNFVCAVDSLRKASANVVQAISNWRVSRSSIDLAIVIALRLSYTNYYLAPEIAPKTVIVPWACGDTFGTLHLARTELCIKGNV